jgi:hypothetical protein
VSVIECDVTKVVARVDRVPYAVVVPYATCELEAWSVVHVIVAAVELIPVAVTPEMTGGGSGVLVVKVKFADVAVVPYPFVDRTSKSYAVEGVSPISITECDVTSVPASVDCDPYAVVVPYATCELETWSVVHVIVAVVELTPVAVTAVMIGAGAADVENVKLVDVAVAPPPLVDNTS